MTAPDTRRAYRIADALDACPAASGEDYAEASYLRTSFRADCRPGGPIGPAASGSYLDCQQARLDRARMRARVKAGPQVRPHGGPEPNARPSTLHDGALAQPNAPTAYEKGAP